MTISEAVWAASACLLVDNRLIGGPFQYAAVVVVGQLVAVATSAALGL